MICHTFKPVFVNQHAYPCSNWIKANTMNGAYNQKRLYTIQTSKTNDVKFLISEHAQKSYGFFSNQTRFTSVYM